MVMPLETRVNVDTDQMVAETIFEGAHARKASVASLFYDWRYLPRRKNPIRNSC